MYAEHCPKIAKTMHGNLDGFKRGLYFVVASIQQQIVRVPEMVVEIDKYGTNAECLFGHKRDAIYHIELNAAALWHDVRLTHDTADAIYRLTSVPGLGIVKSAFACQLMGMDVACLDTRNIKREGRDPRQYRSDGEGTKTGRAWRKRIERYVGETAGKAEHYWNLWCEDVGRVYKREAEEISALHLAICTPRQYDLAETF